MLANEKSKNVVLFVATLMLVLVMGASISCKFAYGESGQVYTASIASVYRNPQTGGIEDAGGVQGESIATPMVQGIVLQNGLMEITSDGRYFLTIRLSLMEYTSAHNFTVQSMGESSWQSTNFGITARGTDKQGQTADFVIELPSKDSIIRATMYVEPMGRSVVWFIYPKSLVKGNSIGMVQSVVTEEGGEAPLDNQATEIQESKGEEEIINSELGNSNTGETQESEYPSTSSVDKSKGLILSTAVSGNHEGADPLGDLNRNEKIMWGIFFVGLFVFASVLTYFIWSRRRGRYV